MMPLNGIANVMQAALFFRYIYKRQSHHMLFGFTKKPNASGESFSGANYRSQAG